MFDVALLKLAKKIADKKDKRPSTATIYAIDDSVADIILGGSLIHNVKVIGSTDSLVVGGEVMIQWRRDEGGSERPVILGISAVENAGIVNSGDAIPPDGITLEVNDYGMGVKKGAISRAHLNFAPAVEGHVHDDSLTGAGWKILPDGSISSGGMLIDPDGQISIGTSPDLIKLDSLHPTYRIWAGDTDPELADFSVSKTGSIKAVSGTIGGWEISSSGLTADGGSAAIIPGTNPYISLGGQDTFQDPDAAGVWMGKHSGVYKVYIGDAYTPGADFMYWDGTQLVISGYFIGVGSDIGGTVSNTFTINSDLDNVTTQLILGRTTGGNASLSWDGTKIYSDKNFQAPTLVSTIATGTAPLTVASTTKVTNLNADKADGYDFNQGLQTSNSPTFVRLTLTQAVGTSPLVITSTTVNTNLNADLVDGYHLNQDVRSTASPSHVRLTLSQAVGTSPFVITSTTVNTNLNADMVDGIHASGLAQGTGAANHVAVWTGTNTLSYDNNQLYWDVTNNRLGIGGVPSYPLHVSGHSYLDGDVSVNAAASPVIRWRVSGTQKWGLLGEYPSADRFTLYDYDAAASVMTYLSGVGLGIGTTTPSFLLDVRSSGSAAVNIQANAGAGYLIIAGTGGSPNSRAYIRLEDNTTNIRWYIENRTISANRFQLQNYDGTNWTIPFVVEDSAPSYSFYINSSGYAGLGTSTPQAPLHIHGSSPAIQLRDTGANLAILVLDATNTETNIRSSYGGGGSPVPLVFRIGNTEKVQISTSGKVGINCTPQYGLLEVKPSPGDSNTGITLYEGGTYNTARMWINSSGALILGRTTSEILGIAISNAGLVKVGSSLGIIGDPGYPLDIWSGNLSMVIGADNSANTRTNSTQKVARIGMPHYTNAEEPMAFLFGSSTSGVSALSIGGGTSVMNALTEINFFTAANTTTTTGTQRMKIASNGYVSIGNITPQTIFHVYSTSAAQLRLERSSATAGQTIGDVQYTVGGTTLAQLRAQTSSSDAGKGEIRFATYDGASLSTRMIITYDGKVGIRNGTPSYKLDVDGDGRFVSNLAVNGGLTVDGSSQFNNSLQVGGGSGILNVNYAGTRVGINCAADAQFDLDVEGNFRAKGFIVGKHAIQIKDAEMISHFDGKQPYETDYAGETNGHMGQVGELVNSAIFRPGKFGKAIQIAKGTTNQFLNSSAEYAPSGTPSISPWVVGGANTIEVSSDFAYIGAKSIKCTTGSGGSYWFYQSAISFTAGQNYVISTYVRKPDGSTVTSSDITGAFIENVSVGVAAIYEAENGWYRVISNVRTAAATGTNQSGFYPGANRTLYFDGLQHEQSNFPTPYCDGSLGLGHSFSGTEHYSTSNRTGISRVDYGNNDNLNPVNIPPGSPYTFMYWIKVDTFCPGTSQSIHVMYQTSDWNYIGTGTTGKFKFYWRPDSAYTTSNTLLNVGEWNHITFVYDGATTVYAYVNGVATSPASWTVTAQTYPIAQIRLNYPSIDHATNGLIDDFAVIKRALTASEVRAIYESDAPIFAETSTFHFRAGGSLVWADENGLWMKSKAGNAVLGAYGGERDDYSWGGVLLDPGDLLIGDRITNVGILWDDSEGSISIGKPSLETIVIDNTKISFQSNAVEQANLTGTTWTLGQSTGYRTEITPTQIRMLSSAGNVHMSITGTSPETFTLGRTGAGDYITIDATNGIKIYGNSSERVRIAADGSGWLANSSISWDTSGNLAVSGNATIAGWSISSSNISSGGINLVSNATPASNKIYVGVGTYANSNTGFYVDGAGYLSLKDKLTWNGTTLSVAGNLHMTAGATETGFVDTFDYTTNDILSYWDNITGTGTLTIESGGDTGGKFLRCVGTSVRLVYKYNIPYDPNRLYRLSIRVRRPSVGALYCGVNGIATDGATLVNVNGTDSHSSQYYGTACNSTPGTSWTEYVGYFTGTASPGTFTSGPKSDPNSPGTLHTNVRYFRPHMLLSWGTASTMEVDEIRLEIMPGTGSIIANSLSVGTLSAITADMGSLTAGSIVIGSTNKLWLNDASDGALNIGGSTKASAPFRVTAAGALTSTSGSIGGWTISSTKISSTGVNIQSGSTAYIAFGTTPPTSPSAGTGVYVDKTGFYGLLSGVKQAYIDATSGALYAGAGDVLINADGIKLTATDSGNWWTDTKKRVTFYKSSGAYSYVASAGNQIKVEAYSTTASGEYPQAELSARFNSNAGALLIQNWGFNNVHLAFLAINKTYLTGDVFFPTSSVPGYQAGYSSLFFDGTNFGFMNQGGTKRTLVAQEDDAVLGSLKADYLSLDTSKTATYGTIRIPEINETTSTLDSGTEALIYIKADKLIIKFNDGGTVRYKYLLLSGTGVTWVHTTTPP